MTAPVDCPGICWDCGCDLRGLPTPRCPECGRAFDPSDPRTMNMGLRMPAWAKRALPPPGRVLNVTVALLCSTMLISGAFPGGVFLIFAAGLAFLFLVGVVWALRALLRAAIAARYHQPLSKSSGDQRRWLMAPALVVVTGMALLFRLPLWFAFLLSVVSLNRYANEAMNAPAGATPPARACIGVFPVSEISQTGDQIMITVPFAGTVGSAGLLYSPKAVPVSNAETRYKPLFGGWYEWRDDF